MGEHTPGPWVSERRCGLDGMAVIASDETDMISNPSRGMVAWLNINVGASFDNPTVTEANARLIAAAPELLSALEQLQDVFAHEGECSMERFERLAAMFRKDAGFLAPGKDPGMLSQQPEGDELRRIYDDWFSAKVTRARTALSKAKGDGGSE